MDALDELSHLADLIGERNRVEREIVAITDRSAQLERVGEYIASIIFDLTLYPFRSEMGSDGYFNIGPLAGQSVDVKWYSREEYRVSVNVAALPDYYLVFSGPRVSTIVSRRAPHAWAISKVHLFQAKAFVDASLLNNAKANVGIVVARAHWDEAELYPNARNPFFSLTEAQRARLAMFAPDRLIRGIASETPSHNGHRSATVEPAGASLLAAIADLFVNDSFTDEVDTYIQRKRQREWREATQEARE